MNETMIIWWFVAVLGAVIGSFLTLATYRLPLGEPIGLTRSRCPGCANALKPLDLIPVLSWLFSLGRCRQCRTRVGIRYPLTELACMLGGIAAAYHYGFTLQALAIAGLWWCIVAIIITDLEHYIILDEVQIALLVFAALYHYAMGTDVSQAVSAGVIGFAVGLTLKYGFLYLRRKDALGMGDVKLLFGAGIWLANAASLVPFLFYAGVLGVFCGMVWRVLGRGQFFPFGPAIALTLLACVLWPNAAQYFWQFYRM